MTRNVSSCLTGSVAIACRCRHGRCLGGLGFGHFALGAAVAAVELVAGEKKKRMMRMKGSNAEKAVQVEVEEENRQRRRQRRGR